MAIYALKPAFQRGLRPVLGFMQRFHPNTVSALAVVCAAAAAVTFWRAPGTPWLYLTIPVWLFLRIAFNALDGMVAVERNMQSSTGEMVNEFSDRLNDAVIFIGLALANVADVRLVAATAIAILLVSYLGILPRAAGGDRRYDGPAGKADRMLVLSLGCFVAYIGSVTGAVEVQTVFTVTLYILLALLAITIILRWSRAWRAFEESRL